MRKQEVADSVVNEGKENNRHFDKDSLKDLFRFTDSPGCDTFDVLFPVSKRGKTHQNGKPMLQHSNDPYYQYKATFAYHDNVKNCKDDVLSSVTNGVSYVFTRKKSTREEDKAKFAELLLSDSDSDSLPELSM
jgi:hypothetical protein